MVRVAGILTIVTILYLVVFTFLLELVGISLPIQSDNLVIVQKVAGWLFLVGFVLAFSGLATDWPATTSVAWVLVGGLTSSAGSLLAIMLTSTVLGMWLDAVVFLVVALSLMAAALWLGSYYADGLGLADRPVLFSLMAQSILVAVAISWFVF